MKKGIGKVIAVICLTVSSLQAQNSSKDSIPVVLIKADTVKVSYENKLRTALQYNSDVSTKEVKKHWKSFLTRHYKLTTKSKGVVMTSKDVVINKISDKRMDLYLQVNEKLSGATLQFFGAFGYDIYIDTASYSKEFKSLKEIAENFLQESATIYYNKKTNDYSKQIAVLTKKNTNLLRDIEKNKARIQLGDQKIETLNDVEDDNTKASIKAKSKILKLKTKKTTALAKIEADQQAITANKKEIVLLQKDLEFYNNRKKVLKSIVK